MAKEAVSKADTKEEAKEAAISTDMIEEYKVEAWTEEIEEEEDLARDILLNPVALNSDVVAAIAVPRAMTDEEIVV
jgi:hypothetical protein